MASVVLLSGGIDSTLCLHLAQKHGPCHALFFNYGQAAHRHERKAAEAVSAGLVESFTVHELSPIDNDNGLTGDAFPDASNMVVEGRNILMLTHAAVHAKRLGVGRVSIGVTGDDYEDFPDCRISFIRAMERALILGLDRTLILDAPLARMGKAAVVSRARAMGIDLSPTRTCYAALERPCGRCPACDRREQAFLRAGVGVP